MPMFFCIIPIIFCLFLSGDKKMTPLQYASAERNLNMMRTLIAHNAAYALDSQIDIEKLPLHLVLAARESCRDFVKLLVDHVVNRFGIDSLVFVYILNLGLTARTAFLHKQRRC